MAQYKPTVNVTNGSATVTIPGVDATAEIDAGDYFKVYGVTGVYEVASEPSYSGGNTTVTLTAPYQGDTASGVTGIFHRDFSANRGYPLIYTGDLDVPDILRRWALLVDSDVSAAAGAVAAHEADPDPHDQYALDADFPNTPDTYERISALGTREAKTPQQVADELDPLLPLGALNIGKPTTAAAEAVSGTTLTGAMIAAGALVEWGSNANGRYWRWESGLQVCVRHDLSISYFSSGELVGNWTLPASFADSNYAISVAIRRDAAANAPPGNYRQGVPWADDRTVSSVDVGFLTNNAYTDNGATLAIVTAIGVWK